MATLVKDEQIFEGQIVVMNLEEKKRETPEGISLFIQDKTI